MKFAGEFEAIFDGTGFILPDLLAESLNTTNANQFFLCQASEKGFWTFIDHTESALADLLQEFGERDYVPNSEEIFVVDFPTERPWKIPIPAFVIDSLAVKKGDILVVTGLKYRIEFTTKCIYSKAADNVMRLMEKHLNILKECGL